MDEVERFATRDSREQRILRMMHVVPAHMGERTTIEDLNCSFDQAEAWLAVLV
jgi:hypothetical protein